MTEQVVTDLMREMLLTALMIAAPVLVTALGVGLLISILQAITQIQEFTLTFIPKILAIVVMLLLLAPWLLRILVGYGVRTFTSLNQYLDIGVRL